MKSMLGSVMGRALSALQANNGVVFPRISPSSSSRVFFSTSSAMSARSKSVTDLPYRPSATARKEAKAAVKAIMEKDRGGSPHVKRPLVPWQIYMQEIKGKHAEAGKEPGNSEPTTKQKPGEYFKQCWEEFEALPEPEKQRFYKAAEQARAEYLVEKEKNKPIPKRGATVYNLYVKEAFTRKPAGLASTVYLKMVGEDYRKLNEKQRAKYESASKADVARVKTLRAALPPVPKKRYPSGYQLYLTDVLSKPAAHVGGLTQAAKMKAASSSWAQLDEETREKWQTTARGNQPLREKRQITAYNLFMRERIAARENGQRPIDIMGRIGAEWTAMGEEEKKPYRDRAALIKAG
ncbi:hypothetical protein BV898_16482 [Hypsibius exemplaris]|uniref:HMG box domain-containing protein n=1 Tax=Hypsibius exemplaris TaxID=2072580 RepID=A0A9X6RLV7_HYPEX|nr:hypothetical protein BV898_16482 [Hypsibius exemplaris]